MDTQSKFTIHKAHLCVLHHLLITGKQYKLLLIGNCATFSTRTHKTMAKVMVRKENRNTDTKYPARRDDAGPVRGFDRQENPQGSSSNSHKLMRKSITGTYNSVLQHKLNKLLEIYEAPGFDNLNLGKIVWDVHSGEMSGRLGKRRVPLEYRGHDVTQDGDLLLQYDN